MACARQGFSFEPGRVLGETRASAPDFYVRALPTVTENSRGFRLLPPKGTLGRGPWKHVGVSTELDKEKSRW